MTRCCLHNPLNKLCVHMCTKYLRSALYSRPFQSSAPLSLSVTLFRPLCGWLIRAELEFSLPLILLRDYLLTSCDSLKGTVGSASLCGCTHSHTRLYSQSSSITPAKQRTNLHCQLQHTGIDEALFQGQTLLGYCAVFSLTFSPPCA